MGSKNITYSFLSIEDRSKDDYKELLSKIYGNIDAWEHRNIRMEHYSCFGDFRLVVTRVDGELVGQCSAYKVNAIIDGKEQPFYWGCDLFLLPASRGLGIGKNLTKTLHDECPNFSCAWYSPTTGVIERKYGSTALMDLKFTYYPISNLLSLLVQMGTIKLFKKRVVFKPKFGSIYYLINKLGRRNKLKDYRISEIPFEGIDYRLADFMEKSLAQYDFHIKRDLEFLKWAYGWKKGEYRMFSFVKNGKIEAMVSFSNVHKCTHVVANFLGVSILDMVISSDSELTTKDLLLFVIKTCQDSGNPIEGIVALQDIPYFLRFTYPYPSVPLLSTYGRKIKHGYISMIDQDMDQI